MPANTDRETDTPSRYTAPTIDPEQLDIESYENTSLFLISSFQSYVIIYYVFGGDQARGAEFAGYAGTASAISTFGVIVIVTWLGTKLGKMVGNRDLRHRDLADIGL